jgi:hypothetical protein
VGRTEMDVATVDRKVDRKMAVLSNISTNIPGIGVAPSFTRASNRLGENSLLAKRTAMTRHAALLSGSGKCNGGDIAKYAQIARSSRKLR